MHNERGAGRKPRISEDELINIEKRIASGEKMATLAKEYGVSRQALSKRLMERRTAGAYIFKLDYMLGDECATRIEIDTRRESVHIINYASQISKRAFEFNEDPSWEDLSKLLETIYLRSKGLDTECPTGRLLCSDKDIKDFSLSELDNEIRLCEDNENADIAYEFPRFAFTKKDILTLRTDADGYQLKAISHDRRWFVKSQAVIGGLKMNDWKVEITASDICDTLGIPHVLQKYCEFVYAGQIFNGVYSANFELDGKNFVSFERLLEKMGLSSNDEEFISMDAMSKMNWCAEKLSKAGALPIDATLKYMLDLAVIDCLCGNVDRHTRNFGLFFDVNTKRFEIPLIFDNGMGLFEHDPYRDRYESYESAMNTVYVSPYGEDPFDMMKMLKENFKLHDLYPRYKDISYRQEYLSPFAKEYSERMLKLWLR